MQVENTTEIFELRDVVVEASRALAHLNADRLEELSSSCEALNRGFRTEVPRAEKAKLVRQCRAARDEMAVFARILDVTRTNLDVIHRLREISMGHREYGDQREHSWTVLENAHGIH